MCSCKEQLPIAIYNGTVFTTNGLYRISSLGVSEARALVQGCRVESAVGHQGAAELLSDVLGLTVPMRRIAFEQQVGQKAIALKLNVRPEEGAILTREETEAIGYELRLIERLE